MSHSRLQWHSSSTKGRDLQQFNMAAVGISSFARRVRLELPTCMWVPNLIVRTTFSASVASESLRRGLSAVSTVLYARRSSFEPVAATSPVSTWYDAYISSWIRLVPRLSSRGPGRRRNARQSTLAWSAQAAAEKSLNTLSYQGLVRAYRCEESQGNSFHVPTACFSPTMGSSTPWKHDVRPYRCRLSPREVRHAFWLQ